MSYGCASASRCLTKKIELFHQALFLLIFLTVLFFLIPSYMFQQQHFVERSWSKILNSNNNTSNRFDHRFRKKRMILFHQALFFHKFLGNSVTTDSFLYVPATTLCWEKLIWNLKLTCHHFKSMRHGFFKKSVKLFGQALFKYIF